MTKRQAQQETNDWVREFRILKGWKVQVADVPNNHGCSWGGRGKTNSFYIGTWDAKANGEQPKDYLLHEVFHGVLCALVKMDRRKPKELRQAEEGLVRDLCRIIMEGPMSEKKPKLGIKKIDLFHRIIDENTGKPAVTSLGNPIDGGGHHSVEKAQRQLGYITGKK